MKDTPPETMLAYQGDRVLVVADGEEFIFTIVIFVDGTRRQMQLVNRELKPEEREHIPLTQVILENLIPIKHKEAKWKLVI